MSETNLVLTADQSKALAQIQSFVEQEASRVLILSGFAGTGKTTLMRELVDWLFASERRFVMLASTGRAAKVLSDIGTRPRDCKYGPCNEICSDHTPLHLQVYWIQ